MRSKKKISIVVPGHWSKVMGGSQYQVKCLINILLQNGNYEIYYITRFCDPGFNPEGYKIIRIDNGRELKRSVYRLIYDFIRIPKILSEICPDIIYQRVGCAHTGIAARYAVANKSKMIWHIAHDMEVTPYRVRLSKDMLYRAADKKLLEYGIAASSSIVAQTSDQSQLLENNYNRKVDLIVPNFHPYPQEKIEKAKPIKVVWVANLKPWKRPEVFIKLARNLQDKITDVRFIMVGAMQGPADWQNRLRNEIADTRLLEYIGEQTQEEVNRILAGSHIFVNTSRWEGFANTFIQAWMRKVPVVSLELNPDNVFDNYNVGYFSGSYEKMERDVLRLINDPDKRNEMGEFAQHYAFENYSEKNALKILELFDV